MAGLAIATTVASRPTIITPNATASRVSHGWPCPRRRGGTATVRRSGGARTADCSAIDPSRDVVDRNCHEMTLVVKRLSAVYDFSHDVQDGSNRLSSFSDSGVSSRVMAPPTPLPATASEAGLRERKKQRTREALIDAAFELFMRKGFEATTVEEIAEAVEVSPR